MNKCEARKGGDVVVESLRALGVETVFGIPGQHALGLFDALRRSDLEHWASRTEFAAAFAADGYARVAGVPGVVLVSTGPGALFTLPALQESLASSVPIVCISSQIPRSGLGGRRRGYLHELDDQTASFRRVVKSVHEVRSVSQIVPALLDAWTSALTPPYGPSYLEIPQDVLLDLATVPVVESLALELRLLIASKDLLDEAARLLDDASRPMIMAGGGVVRSSGSDNLLELAEKLKAPVVCTFGGQGAFPWNHPLSLQSWLEDRHMTETLESADVLLVVGSGLGELSTNYGTFNPRGHVVQIDADAYKLETNYQGLGIRADAATALAELITRVDGARSRAGSEEAPIVVREVLDKVSARLASQDLDLEQDILAAIREAAPDDTQVFWDMTIMGYWAWSAWDSRGPGRSHSAQGAGGLGYAFPAAIGAAAGTDAPVLAVSGDGGAMYGVAELVAARQNAADVTWLIVDDGGYGILREYMDGAFGESFATELERPDFVGLARSCGVRSTTTTVEQLCTDLSKAIARRGPDVIVLSASLAMFAATHLES